MKTALFIKVSTSHHHLIASSVTEGAAALAGDYPVPCVGCTEDLQGAPCRLGRVECWACGRRYPIVEIVRASPQASQGAA